MKLLLDTNAYSDFKRGLSEVVSLIRQAECLLMSAVVVGELLYGFRSGNRYEHNYTELKDFLGRTVVQFVPVSLDTAKHYGLIASVLRKKGRPIPVNDIWIAAHTLETHATLVSQDQDFAQVDGLRWINPRTRV